MELPEDSKESWKQLLKVEFEKPDYLELLNFVSEERQKYKDAVYPPAHQVFEWTRFCEVKEVKVVIVGQDPYHGPGQAHGLAFSVPYGVAPPPSLANYIYAALAKDVPGFIAPQHGNLICWAQQGVLLLNSILTVQDGTAMSHANKGWEEFTDAVISWLSNNLSGVVFILLGETVAWKKERLIDTAKHLLLKAYHPSPLSAWRGFINCNLFSDCNKYLESKDKPPVNWNIPPSVVN